jgi:hypothetical protein
MDDEKFVREHWVSNVQMGDVPLVMCSDRGPFRGWSAAAEFTRKRLEEIRLVKEEIEQVEGMLPFRGSPAWAKRKEVWQRILKRLEAALAELQRGMKEQSNG